MDKYSNTIESLIIIPDHVGELYTQPHRRYHDLVHIHYMLEIMPHVVRGILTGEAINALAWSVMYHDAVYNIPDPDKMNEELSAQLFLEHHGDHKYADLIAQAIRATKTHILTNEDHNFLSACLIDLDLWALGDEEVYKANSILIQDEVGATDEQRKIGRGAWLTEFLKRDKIYYTPRGMDREKEARRILEADLASLS